MSNNIFHPKVHLQKQTLERSVGHGEPSSVIDSVLHNIARYSIVLSIFLIPLFFTPGIWSTLNFDKVMVAIVLAFISLASLSFLALRKSKVSSSLPVALGVFWLLIIVSLVSSVVSGNFTESLRGSFFEPQTAGFLILMALLMTASLAVQGGRKIYTQAISAFFTAVSLLVLYTFIRFIMGGEFISLGSFNSPTISPFGGLNDLAVLSGLFVLLGLLTLVMAPLRVWQKYALSAMMILSLTVMAVANFMVVWSVVGLFSLVTLAYLFAKDRWLGEGHSSTKANVFVITLTAIICVVSASFALAGDFAGTKLNAWLNLNYIEVRPSLGATVDVAKQVYKENLLLGIGPNQFDSAWRQFRPVEINQTIFWDTSFEGGIGYVPTIFVTTGILGGIAVVLFHLSFLFLGYRMFLRSKIKDSYWYYVALVFFISATFIWGFSYVFIPSASLLLLAALFTGLTFAVSGSLVPTIIRKLPLVNSPQGGFAIMAGVIILLVGSVSSIFSVSKQYVAQGHFERAQVRADSDEVLDKAAEYSFRLYPEDRFLSARAQIRLARMNALFAVVEPTDADRQVFTTSFEEASDFIKDAINRNANNPANYAVLASLYGTLAQAGTDGARERSEAELVNAQKLDPNNPGYPLIGAYTNARMGDLEKTRDFLSQALALKSDYVEALFLLTQLDIKEEKTESAIATTRSLITLEPRNPARYFQLGVLLSSTDQIDEAIEAFQVAIMLDPQYANARYLLALIYADRGESNLALEQLRIVEETNPDNQDIKALIAQIESGEVVERPELGLETPVPQAGNGQVDDGQAISDRDVSSNLLDPLNTVPETESLEQE